MWARKRPATGGGRRSNTLGETKTEAKKTQNKGRQKGLEKKQNKTKPMKAITQNLDGDRQEKRRTGPKVDRSCTRPDPKEQNPAKGATREKIEANQRKN